MKRSTITKGEKRRVPLRIKKGGKKGEGEGGWFQPGLRGGMLTVHCRVQLQGVLYYRVTLH